MYCITFVKYVTCLQMCCDYICNYMCKMLQFYINLNLSTTLFKLIFVDIKKDADIMLNIRCEIG